MGTKKDLATLERQAAEAERRAKKLRAEVTHQKRETRDREDRNAGAALRALWARWAEVDLEDIEAALAPIFGALPSGQGQGNEGLGPLFEQGRGGDRESARGSPKEGVPGAG